MTLFHHGQATESQYLTHLHAVHGDNFAALCWDLRGDADREVMVFRSKEGFADESVAPTSDPRQTLVYKGLDRHSVETELQDETVQDDVTYYYSLFALGDDGAWHEQLKIAITPGLPAHWHLEGEDADDPIVGRFEKLWMDLKGEANQTNEFPVNDTSSPNEA
jgi:hypothetical protein